jgi:hypothetical protein
MMMMMMTLMMFKKKKHLKEIFENNDVIIKTHICTHFRLST